MCLVVVCGADAFAVVRFVMCMLFCLFGLRCVVVVCVVVVVLLCVWLCLVVCVSV